MENKTILETIFKEESLHHCTRHTVVLSGVLKENIVINFLSYSTTEFKYKINYKSSYCSFEFEVEGEIKYSCPGDLYVDTIKDIEKILTSLKIELSKEDYKTLSNTISECISKCKNRSELKSSVVDFYEYRADAVLTIKGEDDGTPKYLVKIINVGPIDEGEVIDILEGIQGNVYHVIEHDMYIWKIPVSEITFQSLIAKVIKEFDNPYLIISPDLEIILDFKMDTSKLETLNSKYDRSVEEVQKLYKEVQELYEEEAITEELLMKINSVIISTQPDSSSI